MSNEWRSPAFPKKPGFCERTGRVAGAKRSVPRICKRRGFPTTLRAVPVQPRPPRRYGFTLLETTVTLILLGAVLAAVAPLSGWVAAQRRAADQRQLALQEAANLLERITSRPWERLSQDALADVDLSEESRRRLREPKLDIEITPTDEKPPGRRITVAIQWKDRAGRTVSPVRLTTWVYRP